MNPLNDDELNSLLGQAKIDPPKPSPELMARTLQAYQRGVGRPTMFRHRLFRRVSVPLPIGAVAALLLVFLGMLAGRALRPPSEIVQTRTVEVPVAQERIVYRDCEAPPPTKSSPIASLSFREMKPVRQISPRIVRSIGDDQ
jgi:hypothetical protein